MPPLSRLTPLVAPLAVALLIAGLILPGRGRAQEQPDPAPTVGAQQPTQRPRRVEPDQEGLLLFAVVPEMPAAPSYVRLLRINLEPGAVSPLHFHPGPEMGLIERGAPTALVEGPTDLLPRGRTKAVPAEEGEEFPLEVGDQVLYRMGSPQRFQNNQEEGVVSILTAVVLAAGNQAPPGLTYVDTPPATGLQGVTSFILGDGCATVLPGRSAAVAIERLVLEAGEPIPAYGGPTMISVEDGTLTFASVSGETQVPPADVGGPCQQPPLEPGAEVTLAPGTGAFFPTGLAEVPRPEDAGELTLLRLTIAPVPPVPDSGTPAATPLAAEEGVAAVIEVPTATTPTPEPTDEPEPTEVAEEPDEEATEEPAEAEPTGAAEPDEGTFPAGTLVEVNDVGVNLRAEPTTAAEVVTILDQGDQLTIAGDPVEADGLLWYPVESAADPTVSGWIAAEFLSPTSEG